MEFKKPQGLQNLAYLIVVFWGVGTASPFLIPISLAGLLAFMMAPLVRLLKKLHIPEGISIFFSALILILPFIGIGYAIVQQGQSLLLDFPSIVRSLSDYFAHLSSLPWAEKLGFADMELSEVVQKVSSSAGKGIALVIGGVSTILNAGSQLLLIFLLAIMMVASQEHLRRSFENLLMRIENIQSNSLVDEVASLIERFLIARLIIVLFIGSLGTLSLQLCGVSYSVLLGAFVGALTLVPAIGFLISLIPVVVVSLAIGHSLGRTGLTVGLLVILNLIDNYILTPKLVGGRLNLNPLATFLGLLAGGHLWGIWGMFLSIPILGVIRIILSAIPNLQMWGDILADKESPKAL